MLEEPERRGRLVGRYVVHDRIAAGGMATVHLGRLLGAAGFTRTVAIKKLHDTFASDPDFVAMLLDEARLTAHIRHPNVVPVLDVVAEKSELLVVMEYVEGDSLAQLARATLAAGKRIPPAFAASIVAQALHGLHAAHEAKDRDGRPLGIVHRDVSPQNILVGVDGVARVLDFGIAKAASRATTTEDGQLKGKASYMAPEHLGRGSIDRRTDVFAAAIVLWELLAGQRLFAADSPTEVMAKVQTMPIEPPHLFAADLPPELSVVVLRGLERDPDGRFPTAEEMAIAIEEAIAMPRAKDLGAWVAETASETLSARAELVHEVERSSFRYEATSTADEPLREAIEAAERRRIDAELPTDVGVKPRSVPPPRVTVAREEPTAMPTVNTAGVAFEPVQKPSRAPAYVGLALAAIGILALLGAVLAIRSAKPEATETPDAALAASPPPSASALPSASSSALVVPPVVTPPTKPSAKPLRGGNKRSTQGDPCQVPFVIDANGNKHFKEECLK